MNFARLRDTLRPHIIALHCRYTHGTLPTACERLGMPFPNQGTSKCEKITEAFDALQDDELMATAERFLALHPPSARERNEIQDLLWSEIDTPEVPKKFRREVARSLGEDDLFIDARRFDELLDRLWVLDEFAFDFGISAGVRNRPSLRQLIKSHIHFNPGDWSPEELFDKLGAFDAPSRRFALFMEGLASPDVRPDEAAQRRFAAIVNKPLSGCGVELRETDTDGGYPVFALVSIHAASDHRPKNLIFASAVKPDIRIRDAVSNNIEIVTNSDKVLVYDRPIGSDGLRWCDLQGWWSDTKGISDQQQAKRSLYRRLRESLPSNSPPQKLLFTSFYRAFGRDVPNLPALLPEVWLHWDPKRVRERGLQALLRSRMDFLLLLPQGIRIVLEVDGKHHYAREDGAADPVRYARMVAADRELVLSGYYVFRFGADEIREEVATSIALRFFSDLFERFKVPVPSNP